jgi:hypothetical protein
MTSQLLATALKSEKPELEIRKSELLRVEEEHKIEIGRLEDFLLEELANATGNLLENKVHLTILILSSFFTQNFRCFIGTSSIFE